MVNQKKIILSFIVLATIIVSGSIILEPRISNTGVTSPDLNSENRLQKLGRAFTSLLPGPEKGTTLTEEEIKQLQGKSAEPSVSTQEKRAELITQVISENRGDRILENNDTFRVIYVPTPDLFIVEIKTEPYEGTKQTVADWFKSKGFTDDELCTLGVNFIIIAPQASTTDRVNLSRYFANCPLSP